MHSYNYDFRFPIIRKKRKTGYRIILWCFYSSTVFFLFMIFFFFDSSNKFLRLLFGFADVFFLCSFVVVLIYGLLVQKFVLIGEIIINSHEIKIKNEGTETIFPLNSVKNINLTYLGNDGQTTVAYGVKVKDGDGNFLEFEELNGTKHKYEFHVEKAGKLRQATMTMKERHIPFTLNNKDTWQ